MSITGLDHGTASELLLETAPGLAALVVDELHSSTGGNPLALLEIVSRLSSSQRAGIEALPAPLPSVGGIEEAFYRRWRTSARRPNMPSCWCLRAVTPTSPCSARPWLSAVTR